MIEINRAIAPIPRCTGCEGMGTIRNTKEILTFSIGEEHGSRHVINLCEDCAMSLFGKLREHFAPPLDTGVTSYEVGPVIEPICCRAIEEIQKHFGPTPGEEKLQEQLKEAMTAHERYPDSEYERAGWYGEYARKKEPKQEDDQIDLAGAAKRGLVIIEDDDGDYG